MKLKFLDLKKQNQEIRDRTIDWIKTLTSELDSENGKSFTKFVERNLELNYPYGASVEDSMEKLKFDLYYVKHQSFMFDMLILIRTVEVVLFGKGR